MALIQFPPFGGKVLQVINGTSTTSTTIASTTFTDTTLSATITPSSNSSKILVLVTQQAMVQRTTNVEISAYMRVLRGTTEITSTTYQPRLNNTAAVGASGYQTMGTTVCWNYLDSPTTTSAITYKTQMKVNSTASSGAVEAQDGGGSQSTITLIEIGA